MRMRILQLVSLMAAAGLSTAPAALAESYKVESAQPWLLPDAFHIGAESEARDVNLQRQIVGWANTSAGFKNAFLYEPSGDYKNVGVPLLTTSSAANAINNHGEVVGLTRVGMSWRGLYWHPSTGYTFLGHALRPWFADNDKFDFVANDINDFGHIVGTAWPGDDQEFWIPWETCRLKVAIHWSRPDSEPQIVYCSQYSNGETYGEAISNYGWIAGNELANDNRSFRTSSPPAVTFLPGSPATLLMSWSRGVNEKGAMVGSGGGTGIGGRRAIYWDGISSGVISLGVLAGGNDSVANDVNYQGMAVGYSERSIKSASGEHELVDRAFIWHKTFGLYELAAPPEGREPWARCEANALHNISLGTGQSGVIVVVGYCESNGKKRAVRWEVTVRRFG
jgi:probable HAF family extracellular repeat protein